MMWSVVKKGCSFTLISPAMKSSVFSGLNKLVFGLEFSCSLIKIKQNKLEQMAKIKEYFQRRNGRTQEKPCMVSDMKFGKSVKQVARAIIEVDSH